MEAETKQNHNKYSQMSYVGLKSSKLINGTTWQDMMIEHWIIIFFR